MEGEGRLLASCESADSWSFASFSCGKYCEGQYYTNKSIETVHSPVNPRPHSACLSTVLQSHSLRYQCHSVILWMRGENMRLILSRREIQEFGIVGGGCRKLPLILCWKQGCKGSVYVAEGCSRRLGFCRR